MYRAFVLYLASLWLIHPVGYAQVDQTRFLYMLGCRSVQKLNSHTGQEIAEIALPDRSPKIPVMRQAHCGLIDAMYDPRASAAHFILWDDSDYTSLWAEFSVPSFKLIAIHKLPGKYYGDDDYAELIRGSSGNILVKINDHYFRPILNKLVPADLDGKTAAKKENTIPIPGLIQSGPVKGMLKLSGYHGEGLTPYSSKDGKLLLCDVLKQIGPYVILDVYSKTGHKLAGININTKEIAVFDDIPSVTPNIVEPSPTWTITSDGRYVLAHYYTNSANQWSKAWLIDMNTVKIIQHWDDKQVYSGGFLAFVPNGDLLFNGFVKHTGLHFALTDPPDGFFADR
ncbi:MAG TPA: hypothetical protein VKX41_03510 [Alloacidobacterium sp.]|jgi:hypothetical protein|nr:hypothetical protein [Alloacidobacterium sp.]